MNEEELKSIYEAKTRDLCRRVEDWLDQTHDEIMPLVYGIDDIHFVEGPNDDWTGPQMTAELVDAFKWRLHSWVDDLFREAGWLKLAEINPPLQGQAVH